MPETMSTRVASQLAFANARAHLLDVAFQADLAITNALATYLGQDTWRSGLLRDAIIGQLSVPQRLKVLFEIMDQEQWHDDLPYVRPVLIQVFEVRNHLAHSMQDLEPVSQENEWIFSRYSVKRGNPKSFDISLSQLRALVRLAQVVIRIDLEALWIRCVPEMYWLDPSNIDQGPEEVEPTEASP